MLGNLLTSLAPTIGSALGTFSGIPGGGFFGNVGGSLLQNWLGSGQQQNNQQNQMPNMNQGFYDQLQGVQSNLLNQLQQQPQFQRTDINPILQGARNDFDQQIVPSIAERFSGMGQGGQRSSSFRNALGAAGSGLSQKLAELQSNHAQDEQNRMMQYRGQNLQQMGLLGNFLTQQNQLGQNQSQFNQQQANTAPYWLSPLLNGLGMAGNIGANLFSGGQNRVAQAGTDKQNAVSNAQNIGLGKQYDVLNNPAVQGFWGSLPQATMGLVKSVAGR